jgi:HPt (histidine-containing phosphotransfer) domain-containing protein
MMPNMNGTEAMAKLRELGYTRPIVVLTANAMIGQAEEYVKSGFDSFISKPIQTKRLNEVLIRFIKDKQPPEVIEAANNSGSKKSGTDINAFQSNPKLLEKLRHDFAKRHKNSFTDTMHAIETGDLETAHRLAHTIKGLAGLIFETPLSDIANEIELVLEKREKPTSIQLNKFEREFNNVLKGIGEIEQPAAYDGEYLGAEEALALFEKLAPLLATNNATCLDMLNDLRKIKGSEEICTSIENFNFKEAAKEAAILTDELRG